MEKLNLTSGDNPIYWRRLCQQSNRTLSVVLPFLFRSALPVALDACSYFALWETFSLASVANLAPTSKRSVPIPSSQSNTRAALSLHPAHLIIPVLWGMSECIHPAPAKLVSSMYSLIGLHYKRYMDRKQICRWKLHSSSLCAECWNGPYCAFTIMMAGQLQHMEEATRKVFVLYFRATLTELSHTHVSVEYETRGDEVTGGPGKEIVTYSSCTHLSRKFCRFIHLSWKHVRQELMLLHFPRQSSKQTTSSL